MKTNTLLTKIFPFIIISMFCSSSTNAPEWGFYGHKRINRMAVFTLPPEMMVFFKKNIEYITEHAVDPDKRRYATKHEGVRHYIDIDHWGSDPFNTVPMYLSTAVMKFGHIYLTTEDGEVITLYKYEPAEESLPKGVIKVEDTTEVITPELVTVDSSEHKVYSEIRGNYVIIKENANAIFGSDSIAMSLDELTQFYNEHISPIYYEDDWIIPAEVINSFLSQYGAKKQFVSAQMYDQFSGYGIIPYHLVSMQEKLTRAFETGDEGRILRAAAEIGHYIGDSHVPLHTTENYNGQLSGQDGIHGFWESRLPELFADDSYNFWVGKAKYIDDPRAYYFDVVKESHSYLDTIFHLERDLSINFPQDKQYCYETRLERTIMTQCKAYATEFHNRLDGMVEKRMTDAVLSIGSVWFSAWVDAGQPSLKKMDKYALNEEEKKKLEEEEKLFKAGDIKGRGHSN